MSLTRLATKALAGATAAVAVGVGLLRYGSGLQRGAVAAGSQAAGVQTPPTDAAPPAARPSEGTSGKTQHGHLYGAWVEWASMVALLVICAGAAFGAVGIRPPSRAIPYPADSLFGSVDASVRVDSMRVLLVKVGETWGIGVSMLARNVGVPKQPASLVLYGVEAAESCAPLRRERLALWLREGCDPAASTTAFEQNRPSVTARAEWKEVITLSVGMGMPSNTESDPSLPREYQATFIVPLKAKWSDLGVVESESDIKMLTPEFVFSKTQGSTPVPTELLLASLRGPSMEWTGLPPTNLGPLGTSWSYSLEPQSYESNAIHGHDASYDAQDQTRWFVAGTLAGLAGSALIAVLVQLSEAIRSRLRDG